MSLKRYYSGRVKVGPVDIVQLTNFLDEWSMTHDRLHTYHNVLDFPGVQILHTRYWLETQAAATSEAHDIAEAARKHGLTVLDVYATFDGDSPA